MSRTSFQKTTFVPKDYQKPSSIENKIVSFQGDTEQTIKVDFLFVGAGPASLAGAIRLKQLFPEKNVTVIEKASRLGGHSLSGAIINPIAFKKLFPDRDCWPFYQPITHEKMYFLTSKNSFRIPHPPTMKNKGFFTASLCEVVRWLGQQAESLGVNIFPQTAGEKLIVENRQVVGIQSTPLGLDRDSQPKSQYQEPVCLLADKIFLCDGVRGNLSQTWMKWKKNSSHYPNQYSLGIKEIWKLKQPLQHVIHTVGFPLKGFGGSFVYPLSNQNISIGLVAGMDNSSGKWNLNQEFQQMKKHPLFQKILEGGECLEWGAKVIPEGGYHSIPNKLHEDGVFILGDAANLVNVPSLKGIHYAMLSGIEAAEYIHQKKSQTFEEILKNHTIGKDLYKVRNVIRTLQTENRILGFIKAGLMILTGGRFPKDLNPEKLLEDNQHKRTAEVSSSPVSLSKEDAVYLSGNKTRDDIPSHLEALKNLDESVMDFYTHFCPAGVYEKKNGKLLIHAPNCIDCKATDILGPEWNPREGGSGPDYNLM